MPICPYFVSGKCNYGNKCYNLHVNIGTNIQTTAKASVSGKQWILSCFAPFEGETVLPNFIEDQSFEEVRREHYEARATNSTHLAEQKFNQSWAHALGNMNRLVAMEPTVQSYLVEVFGANGKRNVAFPGGAAPTPTPANPFASSNPTPSTGSIFGGGASGNNVFGGQQQQQQQNTNPFGRPSQPLTGNSPFQLGQISATTPSNGSSIFGGGASTMQQQQQQANTGNIFGQSGSMFGQPAAPPQNQMQQQPATGNIFAQPQQQTPGSIFGQPVQQNQMQPGGSIFSQNVFGGATMVQQPAAQQQPSVFDQPQQPPNPFQTQSPFGQQPAAAAAPSFGNVFNNLGQNANQAAESAIYGATTQQQPNNVFGMQQQSQQMQSRDNADDTMYSTADKLTQEQLGAFQAPEFALGQIPNVPPPKELCF